MDAHNIGAAEPDDRRMFEAITAELDIDTAAIEQAATTPDPTSDPDPVESPQTRPPAPAPKSDQELAAPTAPAPTTIPAATVPASVEPLPPPVRPERPALVKPTEPKPPELGRAEKTGHYASITGYVMSVGVGAFGQIMFLGTWLEATLPSPGNWIAAMIGAAFAEIGMIGAGNSSLSKRKDGGRWKLLFAVACFVCAAAVTMQVAHWLPKGFGVALVFGLASFVGFLIHMTIEHSKIRDHEDRVADYKVELDAYEAEEQARYEQDLATYEAAVGEQQRQRRLIQQAAEKAAPPAPSQAAPATTKPSASKTRGPKKATIVDARAVFKPGQVEMPKQIADALVAQGFKAPHPNSVQNWSKQLRAEHDGN